METIPQNDVNLFNLNTSSNVYFWNIFLHQFNYLFHRKKTFSRRFLVAAFEISY